MQLAATVQAYFRLEKPVKELLPYIERLEYDINGEIGVPDVKPSTFEILEFYGGIAVIPPGSASIWLMPQIFFNFTLNNSIPDLLDNSDEHRDQLKLGLRLLPHENVLVQITNKSGSTILRPVIIQASVIAEFGALLPERLKELAKIITGCPARNLGLDNNLFGKVNGISLSSYLKRTRTLHAAPPTPSPAPALEPNDRLDPSSPQ